MLLVPIISGFTQTDGEWTGCDELREIILAETDNYSAMSVRPRVYRWADPWRRIARDMHLIRWRYHREPFAVVACAYSFGAGYGLVKLAKNLKRYGIGIDTAGISDG